MPQYLKNEWFEKIHSKLSGLFIDKNESEIISGNAGLDLTQISWSEKSFTRWDSILSRAEIENKIVDLLTSAILQRGGSDILEEYRKSTESGDAFEPVLNITAHNYKNTPPVMLIICHNKNALKCYELRKQFYIPECENQELVITSFQEITDGNLESAELSLVENADIIMPVITPDFFDPQKKYLSYVRSAIEKDKKVVPALFVKCLYSRVKVLKDYLTLPPLGKFISEYENEEEGYADIAEGVLKLVD